MHRVVTYVEGGYICRGWLHMYRVVTQTVMIRS